ncbi:MAG: PKD domain-containing protein [Bacteroidales bacterium]|jgi:uncharacterized delta-60 repeat protein|nr:PKD domain-containing protein [Bacteroidales bacterium]
MLSPGTLHETAHDIVMLEDSSMIICGVGTNAGLMSGFLMRILHDGSQDMSFGTGGITWISYGAETYAYCMEQQADGKLAVAGLVYTVLPNSEFFISRFLPDGSPDLTFNGTGHFITAYSNNEENLSAMTMQPDGKFVLAGSTALGSFQLLFTRVNNNGTLDASFGTNGYTAIDASVQDEIINGLGLMNDGTIIGVGYGYQADPLWGEQVFMAKLNANGTPVSGFGTNGVMIPSVFNDVSSANEVVVHNDSIYLTGYMYDTGNNWQLFLAKLNPSGIAYADFGNNGISLLSLNPLNTGYNLLKTADNKLYICGTSGVGGTGNREFLLARYLPDGDPDPDFNGTGYVITPIRPDWDEANALGIQPNGKIVLAGMTSGYSTTGNNDLAMTRYLNDYLPSGLYANFSANLTSVCEGATVQFTDQSLSTDSTVLTWNWTFQGGTPAASTQQNPTVTYANDGVYDVRLIVYDGLFIDTLLRQDYISVESIPAQPAAPAGPASLCGGYQGTYSTNPVQYADNYGWSVSPGAAGTINGNGVTAVFTASQTWTGTCTIKVRGENQCGNGAWSAETSCLISHNPVQFDLTGEGGYCEGSDGTELILSGSETGVDYELYLDNDPTGIVLPGTGSTLNFGYFTDPGIYGALGYTAYCSAFMVGQIYVYEMLAPGQASMPNGPETGCDGQSATYSTIPLDDADVYIWTLTPEEAGVLTPVFETCQVDWNPGFTGDAALSVRGENLCGPGPESAPLEISVSLTPMPVISGLEIVCDNREENYETPSNDGSFYSWEVTGGVIVNGAGTHQVTVLWGDPGEGSVSVTETTGQGCSADAETFAVTIEICESVGEAPSGNIRIYPNPAGKIIRIDMQSSDHPVDRISVTNAAGQVLFEQRIKEGSVVESVNISDYPAGVYFVKTISKDHVLVFRFHKI